MMLASQSLFPPNIIKNLLRKITPQPGIEPGISRLSGGKPFEFCLNLESQFDELENVYKITQK